MNFRVSSLNTFLSVSLLLSLSLGCGTETQNDEVDAAKDFSTADMKLVSDVTIRDVGGDGLSDKDMGMDLSRPCNPCAYEPESQYDDIRVLTGTTVISPTGSRELPILVRVPSEASGALPVVIWAHAGSWGPTKHNSHAAWSETFAKAGYVVVHFSMVEPTPMQLREICASVGVVDRVKCDDWSVSGEIEEGDESGDNPFQSIAIARAEDPKAVLDALPGISSRLEESGITLDLSSISMAGWSGGAQSVLQLAGASRLVVDDLPVYTSPSSLPTSFVALSPQGPGFSNFYENENGSSWDEVRGPTIVLTGVNDTKDANALTGPVRRRAYELMPAGSKRLFYSTDNGAGIKHGSFNLEGLGNAEPRVNGLAEALQSSVLAFVDCHTRGRQEACDWLETEAASTMTQGLVELEKK